MIEEERASGPSTLDHTNAMTVVKDCRHGKMVFLRQDRYIGRSLEVYGEYCEIEANMFSQIVRPGDVVVEAGANIGAHTIHLAKLAGPRGRVVAFEPQRVLFQMLCANAVLNELFNVHAHSVALGREAGTIKVPTLNYGAELNFGGVSLGNTMQGTEVPVRTVDSLGLPSLRLLKVDVEGMEVQVLHGAQETIGKYRPVLYVENDRESQSEELISLIEELGYQQWWHLVPLFNARNFANNPNNIFGGTISVNLLCFAKEWKTNVTGLRQVSGSKDWWKKQR